MLVLVLVLSSGWKYLKHEEYWEVECSSSKDGDWRRRKQRISMFKYFTKRVKEARNRLVVIHPHCLCHFLELKVIYALSQLFLSTQQLASQYLKVDWRGGKSKKKMYNEVFVIIETDLYEICVYFRNYYIINSCI